MKDFSNLPVWLPKQIEKTGLSYENFARRVNLSRAQLYRYLEDRSRPSEQVMARICRLVEIPFDEGLRQYVPKKNGRPVGSGGGVSELKVRREPRTSSRQGGSFAHR